MAIDDPLDDALELLAAHGVDDHLSRRIITELRSRWGGSQIYLRKRGRECTDIIRHGLEQGQPVETIARAAGVHPATIRRRRSSWLG